MVGVAEDAFPRTRLTHSLETAQVGRELAARRSAPTPDLVDAACLAHDLGHPPFGHNGETALDEAAAGIGGFEGNAQSLRLLTRLEVKVLGPDGASAGLNLTRATLDAATKYPWPRREGTRKFGVYADDLAVFGWLREGAPGDRRCLEAQVMDWADDVAYSVHDVEDGLHAGHVGTAAPGRPRRAGRAGGPGGAGALRRRPGRGARRRCWPTRRWPRGFDRSLRAQVGAQGLDQRHHRPALRRRAARPPGRAHGPAPLRRYDADLVVPERARAECALLKAVAVRYVMALPHALRARCTERAVLPSWSRSSPPRRRRAWTRCSPAAWAAAPDDAARLRVVVDQVAGLTDASAHAWHARLSGAEPGSAQTADDRHPHAAAARPRRSAARRRPRAGVREPSPGAKVGRCRTPPGPGRPPAGQRHRRLPAGTAGASRSRVGRRAGPAPGRRPAPGCSSSGRARRCRQGRARTKAR